MNAASSSTPLSTHDPLLWPAKWMISSLLKNPLVNGNPANASAAGEHQPAGFRAGRA